MGWSGDWGVGCLVGQVQEEGRLCWMVGDHFHRLLGQQVRQELAIAFKGDIFTIMEVVTKPVWLQIVAA